MRLPTPDELAELRHQASSVQVRTRGRLAVLRVTCPDDVDADALRAALTDLLDTTPLRGAEVWVQTDPGELRVLGAVFD